MHQKPYRWGRLKSVKAASATCLKKTPQIIDKLLVTMVCIDDFALRKRHTYGTVMVNLETHRIIDILPSRDTEAVRKWLLTFPNIKLVSRDGASTYASAVTNSHPNAVQVSDRFHFIKALSEAVDKYIRRTFPSRVEIPATECITEEMRALYDTSNRSMRIRFAQKKRKEGLTTNEIALLLHSSPKTVSKYLAIPEDEIPEDRKILKEREHQLAIQQKQKEIEEAKRLYAEGYSVHTADWNHVWTE